MTRATFRVEISFTTGPMQAPNWVDVTQYVRGPISIRRGRQRELGQMEAGTASVVLDNRDRRFDPEYASGPYYGYIIPMRRFRISVVESESVAIPLFTGFVERWVLGYDARDAWVTVEAVDAMKLLSLATIWDTAFPEQRSDERIDDILDAVNWTTGESWVLEHSTLGTDTILAPNGDRMLMEGRSTVAYRYADGESALDLIREEETAEGGLFFVDCHGIATFLSRHHTIIKVGDIISVHKFSNSGSEAFNARYEEVEVSYDEDLLYNAVTVSGAEIVEQTAEDASSIAKYFRRSLTISSDAITNDEDGYQMANFLLNRYKEPWLRVKRLVITTPTTDWTERIRRAIDLGTLIGVAWEPPPYGSGGISQYGMVQGIEHDISETGIWRTTYDVYALDPNSYWALGNEYTALGTNTRLAW